MAYAFDQLDQALGGGQGQQNTNVFGQSQASQDPGQSQTGGSDVETKTSGDDSPGVTESGPSSSTSEDQPKVTASQSQPSSDAGQKMMSMNQNTGSDITQNFQGQLSDTQNQLQDEANTYTQTNSALGNSGPTFANIDAALGGDTTAQGQVSSGLASNYDPTVAAFTSGVNTQVPGLSQLNSVGGLQNYYQGQGNAEYSQGDAALDAQITGGNQQFQQGVAGLNQQQQALLAQQQDENQNLQATTQAGVNQAYDANKQADINYLNQKAQGIIAPSQAQASFNQNQLGALGAQGGGYLNAVMNANTPDIVSQLAAANPSLAKYITSDPNLDASKFVSLNSNAGTPYYTQDQANQYNLIQQMLGSNQQVQAAQGGGNTVNFDSGAYKNALLQYAQQQQQAAAAQAAQQAAQQQQAQQAAAAAQAQQYAQGGAVNQGNSGMVQSNPGQNLLYNQQIASGR